MSTSSQKAGEDNVIFVNFNRPTAKVYSFLAYIEESIRDTVVYMLQFVFPQF